MEKRTWRKLLLYGLGALAALIVLVVIAVPLATDCTLNPEIANPAPPGWREGNAKLPDGGTLHYDAQGTGEAVLLIHGTGGGTAFWPESIAHALKGRSLISYDRRGFGGSSALPATDNYFHQHGEDAAALIRYLGLAPATIVAHSAGGIVALDLAVHHPDLVARLVLMEPPFRVKEHVTPAFALTFARMQLVRPIRGSECAAQVFLRFASERTDGVTTFLQAPRPVQEALLRSSSGILGELDAGTGEQLSEEQLRSVRVPTVLLVGDLTPAIFRESSERVRALVPNATVRTVAGAGHAMQMDAPTAFERELMGVLASDSRQ